MLAITTITSLVAFSSIKCTLLEPLDKHSSPKEPVPAYKSNTFAFLISKLVSLIFNVLNNNSLRVVHELF